MIGNCSELRAIFVAGNPFVEIAAARTLASCRGPRGPGAMGSLASRKISEHTGTSCWIWSPHCGSSTARTAETLSSEKGLLALISCTEAVGKARPGVELSTAPEAFELHTKYYHPTEAGWQQPFDLSVLFPNSSFRTHTTEESVMQWLPGLKISGETRADSASL